MVETSVYLNPGVRCQLVIGRAHKRVGVAGGKGGEHGVVGCANCPPQSCCARLGAWLVWYEGYTAGGYEVPPVDWLWGLSGRCGHSRISLLSA